MNGLRTRTRLIVAAVLVAAGSGCHGAGRRTAAVEPGMTAAAPTLGAPTDGDGSVIATAPPSNPANENWVSRHPLFSRPKHYYDSTQSNKIVKAGVATVVGVPAGIYGEMKQIVTGEPDQPKY
ncbi:MAG: hypothetical protein U0794_04285 [Isosphaeraceae bacterium]